MKRFYIVVAILLFAKLNAWPQQGNMQKELNEFFSTISSNGDISGSVLVAQNDKILYQQSFGYADAGRKVPNTANTLFQLPLFPSYLRLSQCSSYTSKRK